MWLKIIKKKFILVMKAIISHDIDHLTLSEHLFKDLIVSKYYIRSYIEFIKNKITFKELLLRHFDIFHNKWQNIENLVKFNQEHSVPSSFFIGVKKGLGLTYDFQDSIFWIEKLLNMNCEVGLHGIEFDSFDKIKSEFDLFNSLPGINYFGTRMHYIRKNDHTLDNMSKSGFLFDSSEMAIKAPYKIGDMWEIPFQIMDGYIIERPKKWQNKNFYQACEETKKIIDKSFDANLPYLGIDFHDRYYTNSHKTWKNWYEWLVNYLCEQKIEFINFNDAVRELESSKNTTFK